MVVTQSLDLFCFIILIFFAIWLGTWHQSVDPIRSLEKRSTVKMRRDRNACGTFFTQVAVTELPRSVGPVVSCQCWTACSSFFFFIKFSFPATLSFFFLFYWFKITFIFNFSYLILKINKLNYNFYKYTKQLWILDNFIQDIKI